MLPKNARLSASEVREVLARGKSVRTSPPSTHLTAKFLKKDRSFGAAVVVSKSLARSAVLRNRLRRALYNSLSEPFPRGVQTVFFVRKIPEVSVQKVFKGEVHGLVHNMQ